MFSDEIKQNSQNLDEHDAKNLALKKALQEYAEPGLSTEKGEPLYNIGNMYKDGILYASQDWVKPHKKLKAREYNTGHMNVYDHPYPTIYWAFLQHNTVNDKVDETDGDETEFIVEPNKGKIIFIVGDGHHRVSDAIDKSIPIYGELDIELRDLNSLMLGTDKDRRAQIQYAPYGLEGIWPFSEFLQQFKDTPSHEKHEFKVAHQK